MKERCAKTVAQRDDLVAEVNELKQRVASDAAEGQGAAGGAGPAALAAQAWQDAVRLTERLAEVASVNAEILSENSTLTKQVEVRPGCAHPPRGHTG